MKRLRTDYTLEFRQEAVRLVGSGQGQVASSDAGLVSPMTFEANRKSKRTESCKEDNPHNRPALGDAKQGQVQFTAKMRRDAPFLSRTSGVLRRSRIERVLLSGVCCPL